MFQFAFVLILNLFKHGFCQINEESSQGVDHQNYFNKDNNEGQPQDLMAIESKPNPIFTKQTINNNLGYLEKKVTTIKHAPKLHFQIGKPIYTQPIEFKQHGSNINWIKSPVKAINFNHGKPQALNYAPQLPKLNLKGQGITKQLNNLIPTNFGINSNVLSSPPVYDFDFGKFKTSSILPAPQIAAPQLATPSFGSVKKPTEFYFSPNIASHSGDYKLDIPKNYGVETLQLEQPKVHHSIPSEGTPVKYATFVPGVSEYDGKTPEHFENYQSQGKSGEANSYVKVTNGKTTYFYQIRHLVNKH